MTSNEYQISAMRTCMESCHNEAYALSGITAEVGELNDKVAKWIRKGICRWEHNRLVFNTSDEAVANKYREELAYELGDVRWFVALLSLLLGYTDEKIEQMNIEKLKDRAMRGVIDGNGDNR